jgi:predicted acyl esterase
MKTRSVIWGGTIFVGASLTAAVLLDKLALASSNRPSVYPLSWHVASSAAQRLPADYAFGRQTKILAAGSVYPPAAMPLPCDIRSDRDVPITLRDGVTIYPGEIVPVDIAIMPASEVFHAGEQLRFTIAGHAYSAPPSNAKLTGMLAFMHPLPPLPTTNAGVHVIHAGGNHQSYLQIPVIP